MDADIQLGELEEAAPKVRLRPDQNRHYAVVGCYEPDEHDLPVFVDIDVMRDIETHALTNTNVELGGVMLGGQFHDDEGNAFVVITDSLRAEHYEATKGSFKFTHETWEAITRQREEFPEDLEMVGWYHTHPDWGVFLSGMDMFICDNFFNRSLDVALVVDPCRDDRGWFQWTGDASERVRRTGGFYLIGSRFRGEEIEQFAELISGEQKMAANIRQTPVAGRINAPAAPIVNIHDSRSSMQSYLIVGMLMMQFMFLGLIAWQMIAMSKQRDSQGDSVQTAAADKDEFRNEGRDALLAEIIAGIEPEAGKKLIGKLDESRAAAAKAASDLEAQRIASDVFAKKNERLQSDYDKLDSKYEKYQEKSKKRDDEFSLLKDEKSEIEQELKALTDDGTRLPIWKDWTMWTAGILLSIFSAVIGFGAALGLRKPDDEDFDDRHDDSFGDKTEPEGSDAGNKVESERSEEENGGRVSGINFEDDRR